MPFPMCELYERTRQLFCRLCLRWGPSFLLLNGNPLIATGSYDSAEVAPAFFLNSRVPSGWYMLEIQMAFERPRATASVYRDVSHRDDTSRTFSFPLYSGRLCKRLIHWNTPGRLRFAVPVAHGTFRVQHFRLVWVTASFARSRMFRKLRALHPYYTSGLGRRRYRGGADATQSADLAVLWKDYCALFEDTSQIVSYTDWIREFDTVTDDARAAMHKVANGFPHQPLITIVMPVFNPHLPWLEAAISSVRRQIYPKWELCIADDASADPAIHSLLEHYASLDKRIKLVFRERNGHISAASNSALAEAQGEWIALLDHDDMLAEHALFWVIDTINRYPACRLIYSDEDKLDERGERKDPYFKCDWNPDLFFSQNMISHLGVYHAELVREVRGFRIGLEGSQDYDLALRCVERIAPQQIRHIARVLYHWRIHSDSAAHSSDAKPYAMIAAEQAIREHFHRRGLNVGVETLPYGYRVRYALPERPPLVSLIVPTRDGVERLRHCVESILTKTTYPHFEILIIDNGSNDRKTLRYLHGVCVHPLIRVFRDDRPFNYSALNNAAVNMARGEVVGLINDDVAVINPDWLSEMVSHALRPEVGAVGARLWYSDETLQHAGVVLGIHGIAGHAHSFLPRHNVGYYGRASLIQSFSAVTGACLLVRKSLYQEIGGLNETELPVACNDVDFCLRLREAGYRNIWTPYAELYHHESATRGADDTPEKRARAAREVAYMKQRWGDLLGSDPAYSPNLSLEAEDFRLAWPPRVEHTFFGV